MPEYDNTNTAIAFVESGLFTQEGVQAMGNKPILKINVNIDGVDKVISLWFVKDKETGEYKLTKNGSKMLSGKVELPYVNPNAQAPVPEQAPDKSDVAFDDKIPF
ncbi:MAG: hypothetical protein ABGY11_03995 [Candidatus Thioglobus sp.]|jgi:hypothetical protein